MGRKGMMSLPAACGREGIRVYYGSRAVVDISVLKWLHLYDILIRVANGLAKGQEL
jgi:hypothetical protein